MCFSNPLVPMDFLTEKALSKAPSSVRMAANPAGELMKRSKSVRAAADPFGVIPGVGTKRRSILLQDTKDEALG